VLIFGCAKLLAFSFLRFLPNHNLGMAYAGMLVGADWFPVPSWFGRMPEAGTARLSWLGWSDPV
jgi:hypothetical protein